VRTALAAALALWVSAPLAAQASQDPPVADHAPSIVLRPFFMMTGERFAAKQSFDAEFGQSFEPFFGGGLELVFQRTSPSSSRSRMSGFYVDVAASRFKKTGQRAFLFDGQRFTQGIPLTATVTPLEVTGGYRFRASRRVFPYVGVGVGSYGYTETSELADPGENIDTRHSGYLAVGGAEVRVHRWVGIAGDVQYTRVPGILGTGGISQQAGENDLGGITARLRVTVGR
jgi:hypothetical protein